MKKWLFFPAVLLGVVTLLFLVQNRSSPEKIALTESSRAVRYIEAQLVDVVPIVVGTGNVTPSQVWQGVAQVSGKIVKKHTRLKNGALIKADEILLSIDSIDYELAIAQADANIQSISAQLAAVDVQENNAKFLLKIEQKSRTLMSQETERKRKLLKQGQLPRSNYDKQERELLSQDRGIQGLRNQINLYPMDRLRLNAEMNRLQAQLATAKLNLQRTTIKMPFMGRVSKVNVDMDQYVRQGELMVTVDSIDTAEILVQIPMWRMNQLMRSTKVFVMGDTNFGQLAKSLSLSAEIFLRIGAETITWSGKIVRVSETLDIKTQLVGLVVEVAHPYANVQPGIRPPLVKGLFVTVILRGTPKMNKLVVPQNAIHAEQVYIVNQHNRLVKRDIVIGSSGSNYVTISQGIHVGDKIIVSDLVPAIENMLLTPIQDPKSQASLLASASGRGLKI